MACERCRMKKLRCMGGHPCSGCQRAKAECDFGNRAWESQQNSSLTNQRLAQLEKTIAGLVIDISHLARTQPAGVHIESSARASPSQPQYQPSLGSSVNPTGASHHVSAVEEARDVPCLGTPPLSDAQTTAVVPQMSFASESHPSPLAPNQVADMRPELIRSPSVDSRTSERLESRWDALQKNTAPFPPLMSHPTAWSGKPSNTSPDDSASQVALGMTHYKAQVHLHSEPLSEGIVSEVVARALFTLFFQKCHPSFPLLQTSTDLKGYFDQIRSSSPFLLTSILAVAGRYYTGYRGTQLGISELPPIAATSLGALADLACAHLGFVLFRKQHQLADVQAVLLLSVWIPRGSGQSADQWMVSGLCTRLAYRIGIPDLIESPAVLRLVNSPNLDVNDVREIENILPQWHTWLVINQYDTSLSLGFGRPHMLALPHASPRQYLAMARKLGSSARIDLTAAAYVTSLVELSAITTDLITGLRNARLQSILCQGDSQPDTTVWTRVWTLLSDLNPRLDEWQRQWTWGGSYDAIALGTYTKLVTIYGEHARLCLNSVSLNLILSNANEESQQDKMPYLARACEAAISIVQNQVDPSGPEPFVRYGADYIVLILCQAAVFLVRMLAARFNQTLPIEKPVLLHYLKTAIDLMESNDISTTGICGWMVQLIRDLARYAGASLDNEGDTINNSLTVPDLNFQDAEWDFDVGILLGQTMPAGETGLDLSGCFDFAQSFYPQHPESMVHGRPNSD
ncbi:hypothetical protein NW764_015580 [Fusarium oxysporum]|nr:hypothetical protein NW764_015580 [Fusarium oxysporum]